MKTISKKQYIPGGIPPYSQNAALQLIVITGVTYIAFHIARVVLLITGMHKDRVFHIMFSSFGMSDVYMYSHKWWTVLSYGWLHTGFFDWLANMIWTFCFASVLQNTAGFKTVIPLFAYALLAGGGFYMAAQGLLPETFRPAADRFFLGSYAGVMALATAALTLAPQHHILLARGFSLPLSLMVLVYVILSLIAFLPQQPAALMLCLGGALTGLLYAVLLQRGFQPGAWIYHLFDKLQASVTPDESKLHTQRQHKRNAILSSRYEPQEGISRLQIDRLLDKINEKGYQELTQEEKDLLTRAAKE